MLDIYAITLNNYQSIKKELYEQVKEQLLQNQFAYESREEKSKDSLGMINLLSLLVKVNYQMSIYKFFYSYC